MSHSIVISVSTKKAFITGISGQDGYYLAALLLERGYQVYGLVRRRFFGESPLETLKDNPNFFLKIGDLTDGMSIMRLISEIEPDEIYNLGAQSHVKISFDNPMNTGDVNGMGCTALLESIKNNKLIDKTKFYQAGTSEMFGASQDNPQNEDTPFYPQSPYAAAKLYAHWMTINYREAYNLFGCNGILFNHESPHRDPSFVTRKITQAVARYKTGQREPLCLGNLNAQRDWGHARDYVEAMWLMLQQDEPDDYVIATGQTLSVRDFCTMAFKIIDVDLEWQGEGLNEKAINKTDGQVVVSVDQEFFRPLDVHFLKGDPSKAVKKLGWNPQKTKIEDLIEEMVEFDLSLIP